MLRTVVVPLDGSALAEHALTYAERLAEANTARLVLCRVVPVDIMQPAEDDWALAGVGARLAAVPADSGAGDAPGLKPLPKRVRLANLAAELREQPPPAEQEQDSGAAASEQDAPPPWSTRSGATIGAFQRQSRIARGAAQDEDFTTQPTPGLGATREEDGR